MSFVPFDEFDQDSKFPHKSSRTILDDLVSEFDGVQSIQAGIGIAVDDTDPANPFVSAIPYVLPQATNAVLGGIRLGENLIYDSESGLVNVSVLVQSVNGTIGNVVLNASDVGADPAGSATTAVGAHLADADPHPQYTTVAEAAAAAPVQSVNGMYGDVTITIPPVPDEVQEYANAAAFPVTGLAATVYIDQANGVPYRWNGATYDALKGDRVADQVLMGNISGALTSPYALTATQVKTLLGVNGSVKQYANFATFPGVGATDALYIAADTGLVYWWDGSAYLTVGGSGGTSKRQFNILYLKV